MWPLFDSPVSARYTKSAVKSCSILQH